MTTKKQTTDLLETAQAQAAQDEALMAMLQAQQQQTTPRKTTLGETFVDAAQLIQMTRTKTKLSEHTLLKLWELTLMWQLNNRQQVAPSIYADDSAEATGPVPNEIISGTPEEN